MTFYSTSNDVSGGSARSIIFRVVVDVFFFCVVCDDADLNSPPNSTHNSTASHKRRAERRECRV